MPAAPAAARVRSASPLTVPERVWSPCFSSVGPPHSVPSAEDTEGASVNRILAAAHMMDLDEQMRKIESGADGLERDGYHESARLVREAAEAAKAYYEAAKPFIRKDRP